MKDVDETVDYLWDQHLMDFEGHPTVADSISAALRAAYEEGVSKTLDNQTTVNTMKLHNFDEVEKLVRLRLNLWKAIHSSTKFAELQAERGDPGNKEMATGYGCHVTAHRDGSGANISMDGCYVGVEVAKAIYVVLEDKLTRVEAELRRLGVDVDAEDFDQEDNI